MYFTWHFWYSLPSRDQSVSDPSAGGQDTSPAWLAEHSQRSTTLLKTFHLIQLNEYDIIQGFHFLTKTTLYCKTHHHHHHTAANLRGSSSHGGPAVPATTFRNHCVRKLKFILAVARSTRGQGPDQSMSSSA